MKFALATLYVKDMEKSLEFYNKILEIPIVRRQLMGEGKELIFMGIDGEANLELIPADEKVNYSGFSIGFTVESLLSTKEKLNINGYTIKPEISPNNFTTICFLNGPNGEKIELIEYKSSSNIPVE